MDIKISFTLSMTDENLHSWANEYGLEMDEVASDATHHLGELVQEKVSRMMHVKEFTSLRDYQVR